MKKKMTAHRVGTGISAMASGYTTNTRDGPAIKKIMIIRDVHKQYCRLHIQVLRIQVLHIDALHIRVLHIDALHIDALHIPPSATSDTGTPLASARYPNTENTANPAYILVLQLMMGTINESLKIKKDQILHGIYFGKVYIIIL